jgi:hypothetical protein
MVMPSQVTHGIAVGDSVDDLLRQAPVDRVRAFVVCLEITLAVEGAHLGDYRARFSLPMASSFGKFRRCSGGMKNGLVVIVVVKLLLVLDPGYQFVGWVCGGRTLVGDRRRNSGMRRRD